jgi:hypothetical protein
MYTVVIVDGEEYVDATQQNSDKISPEWTTFAFVDSNTTEVNISIALYDEDVGNDDLLDINPEPSSRTLLFTFNLGTGNISSSTFDGIHNSEATGVTTVGDEDKPASLSFYVATKVVGSCGSQLSTTPVASLNCRVPHPPICEETPITNEESSSSYTLKASLFAVIAAFVFILL